MYHTHFQSKLTAVKVVPYPGALLTRFTVVHMSEKLSNTLEKTEITKQIKKTIEFLKLSLTVLIFNEILTFFARILRSSSGRRFHSF